MISIERARQIIQSNLPEVKIENGELLKSLGLRLSDDIKAPVPMPGFANSVMDGYAIAPTEGFTKESFQLEIIGESRAGHPFEGQLQPGTAVIISTGAEVPKGTDRIIPVEVTSEIGNRVTVHTIGKSGAHIRRQGEETVIGDIIGAKYQKLNPVSVAHLARFGVTEAAVFIPPKVSVITTGEELVPFDQQPALGQIPNTNQIFLTQFLNEIGIQPELVKHVSDNMEETIKVIEEAADITDIIIITGGVSVGEHDHVKAAAETLGFQRRFWKVAQKPGKPLYFAAREGQCLFGLPGNPLSVIMTCFVYVYPVIRTLLGGQEIEAPKVWGKFNTKIKMLKSGREKFFLVKMEHIEYGIASLTPLEHQQSHRLSGAVEADGFIIIPGDKKEILENDLFPVYSFSWSK